MKARILRTSSLVGVLVFFFFLQSTCTENAVVLNPAKTKSTQYASYKVTKKPKLADLYSNTTSNSASSILRKRSSYISSRNNSANANANSIASRIGVGIGNITWVPIKYGGGDSQNGDLQQYDEKSITTVEPSKFFKGLIVLSGLYLLLGFVLFKGRRHTDHDARGSKWQQHLPVIKTCDSDPQIWHHNAGKYEISTSPYARTMLQRNMLDMFYDETPVDYNQIVIPDITRIGQLCGKSSFFYGSNPNQMMAVEMVKNIFMEQSSPNDVYLMAKALRQHKDLNQRVWYEAIMKTVQQRADIQGMVMPGPMDAIPDSFIPSEAMNGALGLSGQGQNRSYKPLFQQQCARIDGSIGQDNGIENRLWYWREDLALNAHHWYWHLTNPLMAQMHPDRSGELFYYFHHGIVARYNIERLCNRLARIQPLPLFSGTLLDPGYNSHLDDTNSRMRRTDRPPRTPLSDVDQLTNPEMPQIVIVTSWLEVGRRIGTDISNGYLISEAGQRAILPRFEGIDIVGNTVEATDISYNPAYYDRIGFHNLGHVLIALSVDPNFRLMLPPGPMGDTATALRDPIFYPYHTVTDNLFDSYKKTLPPYQPTGGDYPLLWNGVTITDVKVQGLSGRVNDLMTFFNEKTFELGVGLAFDRNVTNSPANQRLAVCVRHLDHEEFTYEFTIERKTCARTTSAGTATVRVFLAPRFDENGIRFWFAEQRKLFVPLDSFTINLNAGKNLITRRSMDSTLTIPFGKSLQQLQAEFGSAPEPSCGCGWPHHLLLPRGTRMGKVFDLFVMVTNGDDDIVRPPVNKPTGTGPEMCRSAPIYCGIRDQMYPDSKPMGYPFDRYPYQVPVVPQEGGPWDKIGNYLGYAAYRHVSTLDEYVRGISNMVTTQIKITQFDDGIPPVV